MIRGSAVSLRSSAFFFSIFGAILWQKERDVKREDEPRKMIIFDFALHFLSDVVHAGFLWRKFAETLKEMVLLHQRGAFNQCLFHWTAAPGHDVSDQVLEKGA